MTTPTPAPRARLADHALATFLAPLLVGRRVAVVGSTSGDVAHRVRALGAQTVVCFGGVAEDMAVRALTPGALASFHGKLDVVLVPDAGAVPSLVAVLDEARRALGSAGVVAVGADATEGGVAMEPRGSGPSVGYHDLVELCSARFAEVRVLGRGPFLGYALAALDEEPDGIALDTRLMEGAASRPEAFVALASDTPVTVDPLAVVQVPDELLGALREGAGRELREQLAEKDRKLKEVEAASAERWVKVQRYEHGIKELEDENRKARDRGVRLQKDLDDERKLRQRIELDAQMNRRAPELPRAPDPEVERLKTELAETQVARSAAAASIAKERDEVAALRLVHAEVVARVQSLQNENKGLRSELDETQAMEAELQSQVAEATSSMVDREAAAETLRQRDEARVALTEERSARVTEHARLEELLAERTREVIGLQSAVARGEEAVRELAFGARRATEAAEVYGSEAVRESPSGASEGQLRAALDECLAKAARWEADAMAHAAEAQQLRWRNDELSARLAAAERSVPAPVAVMVDDSVVDALRERLEALEAREARLDGALRGMAARVREGEGDLSDLGRVLAEARGSAEQNRQSAHEARSEVSRLYALNLGLEARLLHRTMELEGARAGFERRVAELQQEEERLLRALEVVGTQSAMESREALAARQREVVSLEAEREGMEFRLRECEAAVVESALTSESDGLRRERDALQVSVAAVRGDRDALTARLREAEEALARAASGRDPLEMEPGEDRREGATRTEQVLADLAATAKRLAETEESLGVHRAERERLAAAVAGLEGEVRERRTDHEVLRVELEQTRANLAGCEAEVSSRSMEVEALTARVDELAAERAGVRPPGLSPEALTTAKEAIRAMLIEGRGALVAFELTQILRALESAG